MRQRAKTAERELAKLAVQVGAGEHHDAEMINHELHHGLEEAGMSREQLEEALERGGSEAAALEQNIHELMENLPSSCAAEAGRTSEKRS